MNPVINHCPVEAEILNSVLILGKATLSNVWFKIAINIPNNIAAKILPLVIPAPKTKSCVWSFIRSFTRPSCESGLIGS